MKHLTPLRAIRQHCLACASRPKDVRECPSTECILYQYRMGRNPARKGIGPKKVYARSISDSVLPNPMRVSERFLEGIKVGKGMTMSESRSLNQCAKNTGKQPLKMESQGKIQICREGKEILIRVTAEN